MAAHWHHRAPRTRPAQPLAWLAVLVLALGFGRQLVHCQTQSGDSHLEFAHWTAGCRQVEPVCCGHGAHRGAPADEPDDGGPDPQPCVDRPLLADEGLPPSGAAIPMPVAQLVTVLPSLLPAAVRPPTIVLAAVEPPRPRPPTELRRTVVLHC